MSNKRKGKLFNIKNIKITPSRVSLFFTVISVVAAVISTYFAIENYQSSLPKVKLEQWDIISTFSNTAQEPYAIAFQAIISNVGGKPVSLLMPFIQASDSSGINPPAPTPYTALEVPTFSEIATPSNSEQATIVARPPIYPIEPPYPKGTVLAEFPDNNPIDSLIQTLDCAGIAEVLDTSQSVCVGEKCYFYGNSKNQGIFVFSKKENTDLDKLFQSAKTQNDDLPFIIESGESKSIVLIWTFKCPNDLEFIPKLDIGLQFNDGSVIIIHLQDKLK